MKVLIAGGGTAGHINPGIAIARELVTRGTGLWGTKGTDLLVTKGTDVKTRGTDVLFVGTERGLESRIVPREGFKIRFIRVSGLKRKIGLDSLKTVGNLFQGLGDSARIIEEFKPDLVIGTGGYVCGPVLFVASMKGIPTLIHEQNAFPGLTNKILARFVKRVCISFEESRRYFGDSKKVVYTGNPVRPELFGVSRSAARGTFGLRPDEKLVVVMGGSLGAEKINSTMVELIEKHYRPGSYRLVFATGEARYEAVLKMFSKTLPEGVEVVKYIYDAASAFAAADVMVCRAGAITVTELATLGVPSVLVPSPNVTANHQVFNAKVLEKNNAACVVLEKDLSAELLSEKLNELLSDKNRLIKMGQNAKKSALRDAASRIAKEAEGLLF